MVANIDVDTVLPMRTATKFVNRQQTSAPSSTQLRYQDTSKLLEIEKKLQEGVAKEQDITSWREETEDKAKKFQARGAGFFVRVVGRKLVGYPDFGR